MNILFIPFVVIFVMCSKLAFDIGRWVTMEQKLQTTADVALLSSLRIRASGLQTIAERWSEVGQFIVQGFANGQVLVPAAQWNQIQNRAETLRRSIGGYRGRVTAVVGVVSEANGVPRSAGVFVREDAQDLAVTAQSFTLRNESGQTKSVAGGWYRRNWLRTALRPQPPDRSLYRMEFNGPADLLWSPRVSSIGRLRWDVDETSSLIQTRGNGGFPGQWSHVLEGGMVNPHRFAVFAGQLISSESEP